MTQSDYKLILINHKNQYSCLNKHIHHQCTIIIDIKFVQKYT